MGSKTFLALLALVSCVPALANDTFGVAEGLHFSLEKRQDNLDGSKPVYKNPKASIEARVNDLLPRMSVAEKVSQMYVLSIQHLFVHSSAHSIQGDLNGWMNLNDPLDDTKTFNATGLVSL